MRISTTDQVLALPSVRYSEKSWLPAAPGVYFVLSADGEVIYVGEAWSSIKARWNDHSQTRAARRAGEVRIAYMVCPDSGMRHEVEAFAIYNLKPLLNVAYKKRKPYAEYPARP